MTKTTKNTFEFGSFGTEAEAQFEVADLSSGRDVFMRRGDLFVDPATHGLKPKITEVEYYDSNKDRPAKEITSYDRMRPYRIRMTISVADHRPAVVANWFKTITDKIRFKT